jgi:hypothetical protein
MSNLMVFIAVSPPEGDALTVAKVQDRGILLSAARAALAEAQREAAESESSDPMLGVLHRSQCQHLEQVFSRLLPELGGAAQVPALTM